MAEITAALVKELRERTGAGMMDCKKALAETNGDIEQAIEYLRKKGLSSAAKKAGRIAAEGLIVDYVEGNTGVIVEVNSETDFVARNEEFVNFAKDVAKTVVKNNVNTVEELLASPFVTGETVQDALNTKIAKIGEKIDIRRFKKLEGGLIVTYIHLGGKIGVIVKLEGGDAALAKDICLHIAASNPLYLDNSSVDPEFIKKEEEILTAKQKEAGKPDNIIPNIVKGQIAKYLKEICLMSQPFVKNPDITIQQLLAEKNAKIAAYARYQVGEGIEKKQENFVEEVMKQIKG
ncbi:MULTISPECIES: translation elongation factor Ts [Calditerrivibrio]|jgi:elongation factor Ts|uniref:Elongation factor Ts n=1 Tax=Calditerrivibrio nitroreducens TaxID=477976 RepID=A0A2J6WG89_9BACT|nr:MAG: elongation factor Ts [Calditerrivibrio nitroreducens]